jgi:uncharacterized protein (TIGR03083 family)
MQPSEHYRVQRQRVTELVQGLDDRQLEERVPGCPAWTVREVLSHLTGLAADVTAGRVEGAGTPPWTAAQVDARKGWSREQLLTEWAEYGPQLEAAVDGFGRMARALVFDVTMHEDDMREALGLPLGDAPTHAITLEGIAARAAQKVEAAGLAPMRLVGGRTALGAEDAAVTLTVPGEGELARVLGGRRSHEQIRELDWTGDPEPYLPHLPLFPPGA